MHSTRVDTQAMHTILQNVWAWSQTARRKSQIVRSLRSIHIVHVVYLMVSSGHMNDLITLIARMICGNKEWEKDINKDEYGEYGATRQQLDVPSQRHDQMRCFYMQEWMSRLECIPVCILCNFRIIWSTYDISRGKDTIKFVIGQRPKQVLFSASLYVDLLYFEIIINSLIR